MARTTEGYCESATKINRYEIGVNSPLAFEVKTFIFGMESKYVSDDNIYAFIKDIQNKIKYLEEIEPKPKSLVAKIDQHKQEINLLVEFCDNRDNVISTVK